ncbi:hypothetical protein UFOVP247_76 [uncultured Caudovirales phage]|uniref:Uncharacterized protein n=1 Tax=uncultured Caudovirales phage TaxID=2100421 RepID=A0A6J7WTI9_9CAUD|nr:hypothetical protein UFOVP247_76 [uncultured Caudovirales phage]
MNRSADFKKLVPKTKKKNFYDEETVSFQEVKRERHHKHYRNYNNALRSKNLDRLLSYDDT